MNLEELKSLTQSFLRAHGYNPKVTGIENSILFSRPTGMGVDDEILVYFHAKGEEGYISSRLRDLNEKYVRISGGESGRKFFLSLTPLGATPEPVKKNNFKYQVPVWFFDREFSNEKKTTPLKQLEERAKEYELERIGQPYKIEAAIKKNDLLIDLLDEIEESEKPCLRIIIAPAGYGKTVLMETLYTRMEEKFIKDKKEQLISRRPLLMLPGHIKQSSNLDNLINNFIGEEYEYGVINKDSFKFMVKNNFAVWLLDGLEELILKIPEELIFGLLEDYIVSGDAKAPQIVIAIRKPVLSTLPELREYLQDYGEWIKVYELSDWEKEQKITYFDKNLNLSKEDIDNFKKDLTKSESLNKICNVPYYCKLIADLKNNHEMQIFNDECELVKYATEKLCEREFGKNIDKDIFPVSKQLEFFKELAEESFRSGKIPKDVLTEYAEIELSGIQEDVKINQISCLQRHALLVSIGDDFDIMHDIVKQYLLGLEFSKHLEKCSFKIFDIKEIEYDSFILRCLIKNTQGVDLDWEKIKNEILMFHASPADYAYGFRNVLKFILSIDSTKAQKIIKDILNNKNLTGLVFKNMDLRSFEFQLSRLDSVRFEDCNLGNANFNACYFRNTFFNSKCILTGASVKGSNLDSIADEKKERFDLKEIHAYLYERTKVIPDRKEPCQAVVNLKKVLEKLTRKGREFKLPKKFLIQTKCSGGINAGRCVDLAIKHGVLLDDGERIKIKSSLFDGVNDFVLNPKPKEIQISLHKVLDDICLDIGTGCNHIYLG